MRHEAEFPWSFDQFSTDTASLGHWDCDVLGAEGAARLKTIVYQIHQVCAYILMNLTCH